MDQVTLLPEVRYGETKNLYIVRLRKSQSMPPRQPTPEEILAGWKVLEDYTGKPLLVNEGHEAGSLHSRTAPHVLTWEPMPGDEILGVLNVHFMYAGSVYQDEPDRTPYVGRYCISAHCDPELSHYIGGRWHHDYSQPYGILVKCGTVLGRNVMLGEDDADGAFGRDALRECIEFAMDKNFRPSMCEASFIPEPEDEGSQAHKEWKLECKKSIVEINRSLPSEAVS